MARIVATVARALIEHGMDASGRRAAQARLDRGSTRDAEDASMWIWVLSVLSVVAAGLAAGVLFGVALANVPGFAALPASGYVRVHQILDRRYEPTMPILVLGAAVADVLLAVPAERTAARILFALGAVLLLVVALVSQLRNVPLLATAVRRADPDRLPPAWPDPRPRWRRWHLVRTAAAVAAFAVTVAAVTQL
jgi:uncharacterized membrane protein